MPAATLRAVRRTSTAPAAAARRGAVNPWLEFHAAFSVLSFGAFALAGLAGGMYLWQERQLKTHRLRSIFFQLPPIADLGRLNARLLAVGFVLLSLGLAAGVGMGAPNTWPHLVWAVVVWALYGFLVQARWGAWRHRAAPGGEPVGGGVHRRAADPGRAVVRRWRLKAHSFLSRLQRP